MKPVKDWNSWAVTTLLLFGFPLWVVWAAIHEAIHIFEIPHERCWIIGGGHTRLARETEGKGDVFARLKQIIVEEFGVDEEEVYPNTKFVDDLGCDSLDTIELVMTVEDVFDIEIPDEETERVQTVNEAVELIKSHLK